MRRVYWLLGLGLAGCATTSRWTPPDVTIERVPAGAWHRGVWDTTATCVSQTLPLSGDKFEQVEWFKVNAEGFFNGERYVTAAWSPNNRIFIIARLAWTYNTVSHEAMHAMTHIYDHRADPFIRCMNPWREHPEQEPPDGNDGA